jgi:orotate phosphoribosyltransferase
MISKLVDTNCVKFGDFTLKSGRHTQYYFDMKNLISHPELLSTIGDKIYSLIHKDCDLLCAVPIGSIPLCSYISTKYNIPMIMVRPSVKKYGTKQLIEGEYNKNSKCVIIDDVITSGISIQEIINAIQDKVTLIEAHVIIDRQEHYKCSIPVKSIYKKDNFKEYFKNRLK